MKQYFAAAMLLVGLVACGSQADRSLEGTPWKLASMEGIPADVIDAEADAFTMEFNAADTMVFGRTNCNRFFGAYVAQGDKVDLGNLGMTRMACPEMQYEDLFVKMLGEVDGLRIKGEELMLMQNGKTLATFRAMVVDQPAQ